MFRIVVDPWLRDMVTLVCQFGMVLMVLMPPPLPDQVVSDDQGPFAPLVDNEVPPTTVTFGSSDGALILPV
jgi:hypothetical protein